MGFLTYRLLCLIHSSSLVGSTQNFPCLCWRRNLRGISSFGEFFLLEKTPRRVWGDFLRASWISFKSWKKNPTKTLEIIQDFRSCCILQERPGLRFSDPKTGLFFKNIASCPSQLATENPTEPES